MNVAVIGHKGFLGSHMTEYLRLQGHEVTMLISNDTDVCFHFGANMGGVDYFNTEQFNPAVSNAILDLDVMKQCLYRNIRLFYPSSACAYPVSLQTDLGLNEEMIGQGEPDQTYGWEKAFITRLSYDAPFDMRVGILHTIFGPGQAYTGIKAKFPPQMAYKAIIAKRSGTPLEVWGDGTQTRTFLYIDDAIRMMYEVAMSDTYDGPVNISSSEVVSINDCVEWCGEILGFTPEVSYNLDKPVGVLHRGADMRKFNSLYTSRPEVSTKEGFTRLIQWIETKL